MPTGTPTSSRPTTRTQTAQVSTGEPPGAAGSRASGGWRTRRGGGGSTPPRRGPGRPGRGGRRRPPGPRTGRARSSRWTRRPGRVGPGVGREGDPVGLSSRRASRAATSAPGRVGEDERAFSSSTARAVMPSGVTSALVVPLLSNWRHDRRDRRPEPDRQRVTVGRVSRDRVADVDLRRALRPRGRSQSCDDGADHRARAKAMDPFAPRARTPMPAPSSSRLACWSTPTAVRSSSLGERLEGRLRVLAVEIGLGRPGPAEARRASVQRGGQRRRPARRPRTPRPPPARHPPPPCGPPSAPGPGRPASRRPTAEGRRRTGPGRQPGQPRIPLHGRGPTRPGGGPRGRRAEHDQDDQETPRRRPAHQASKAEPGSGSARRATPSGNSGESATAPTTASDRCPTAPAATIGRATRQRPLRPGSGRRPRGPSPPRPSPPPDAATAWMTREQASDAGDEGEDDEGDDGDVDRRAHPVEELDLDASRPWTSLGVGRGPTNRSRWPPSDGGHPPRTGDGASEPGRAGLVAQLGQRGRVRRSATGPDSRSLPCNSSITRTSPTTSRSTVRAVEPLEVVVRQGRAVLEAERARLEAVARVEVEPVDGQFAEHHLVGRGGVRQAPVQEQGAGRCRWKATSSKGSEEADVDVEEGIGRVDRPPRRPRRPRRGRPSRRPGQSASGSPSVKAKARPSRGRRWRPGTGRGRWRCVGPRPPSRARRRRRGPRSGPGR